MPAFAFIVLPLSACGFLDAMTSFPGLPSELNPAGPNDSRLRSTRPDPEGMRRLLRIGNRSLPSVGSEMLVLLASIFFALACNLPFWKAALASRPAASSATWTFACALLAALVGIHFLLVAPFVTRRSARPLLSILFVATALATYYMDSFSVYLDPGMIRNVLITELRESRDLLTLRMAVHVVLQAGPPLLLLWMLPLRRRPALREAGIRLLWLLGAGALAGAAIALSYQDLSSLMRNHREVRYLVTPANFLYSTARALTSGETSAAQPRLEVGGDARFGATWGVRARPALFVMVVGETVRAANWGLGTYSRQTTPELARRDVINFAAVRSCGTDTETSLPCMFASVGRRDYDADRIRQSDSLLHILRRAGFDVVWRDNNTGCKGVCAGLAEERVDRHPPADLCGEDACVDEALLRGMDGVLRDHQGNLFVVLHQIGSHGPAYFSRYPAEFRRFTPTCDTADLRACTRQEIVNAYDNSILYTDHFLARVLDFLAAKQSAYDTALLYVADHGESLGEAGLYLHGIPYAVAPSVQKEVPMVMWLSPGFAAAFGLDRTCLRRHAALAASHDNLFHSVLGLLDIATNARDPSLDLSTPCHAG
jgi:lipid A ethanolaminephosphotransferase